MKRWKRALALGAAGLMTAAAPLAAFAASPEFSRTEEEWAQLRDDVLEYEELAGLIHEYNATVQQNAIDYAYFRNEYGETNTEWADKYRELASDLRDAIDYPDIDDSSYGTQMAQAITNEASADTYEESADDALEDIYVKYLEYSQEEAQLVQSAQTLMISYYLNQLQQQIDTKTQELSQLTYDYTVKQRDVGMATDIEVLSAFESLRSTEQALIDDQTAIDSGRKSLLVLCGWDANADAEIRSIPEVDEERITQMDPTTDTETAIANNYTLLSNTRQYENARSNDKKETLAVSMADNERNIKASVSSSYQSVLSSKIAYDLAVTQAALEAQNLTIAQTKAANGQLDVLSLQTQQNTTETAALNVEVARLNLFQAIQSYEWAINGLADA
ncbi:MAG: TolC family protein [Clostridiales bacterium]|nr:TolC family protein [Clostridiales bacterium]